MASSNVVPVISALREDLQLIKASNVNVSSFVSAKLSGHANYHIWKAQMVCLIQSQDLWHIIEENSYFPGEKGAYMVWRYDIVVKGWIFSSMNEELLKDFVGFNHAREVWNALESNFSPSISEDSIGLKYGIELLRDTTETETESTDNIIRWKGLYEAAVEGCWWKAKSILKIHKNAATEGITRNGDTILHLAVEMGHNYFLEKLLEFLEDEKDIETPNNEGLTALHVAAMVDNIRAAELLVKKNKKLLVITGGQFGILSPAEIALDNANVNLAAYLWKSTLTSDSKGRSSKYRNAFSVAIYTKDYDLAETLLKKFPELGFDDKTLLVLTVTFPTDLGFMESFIYPSFHNVRKKVVARGSSPFHANFLDKCVDNMLQVVKICNDTCCSWLGGNSMILFVPIATLYPIYQLICLLILVLRLPFAMWYFFLWKILAVIVPPIKNIEKKKKTYEDAKKILRLMCKSIGPMEYRYKETILQAVQQGNYEVVDEILFSAPATINYRNEEGHNIIQLAIINRSEKVYNLICHTITCKSYKKIEDSSKNNLAHLVGRLAPSSVLAHTTGAALQLQQELKWREEVEKLLYPFQLIEKNIDGETPAMVFTREHQDLMKEGESWMKTTAESCSITAALIVTVVFAAAITVPGGSNQDSGTPLFKKEVAFTIFAIFNAFSLFTSATSLLLFLSILTARFADKDFLIGLPRRLIFGLLTLFLSTTSMIVAFGAILFLVFCDQRPWMLAPICGFACMPISVIVTIKLPLLVDLIKSTYFPMFGKQSYLESCKINLKNTNFMEPRGFGYSLPWESTM